MTNVVVNLGSKNNTFSFKSKIDKEEIVIAKI
jgi:hypothetical protein